MIPLLEFDQQIHVSADRELKRSTIDYAILKAFNKRRYAKFYTNKYYISVCFNRDYTIQISSNYTYDNTFNRELRRIEAKKFSLNIMSYFIWYWMNKFRKMK